MADQDAHVQVAVDGAGKKIDNAGLTRADGTLVHRQRVVLASDEDPTIQAAMGGEVGRGHMAVGGAQFNEMLEVLMEIRDLLRITLQ